jgi:hypothetical protein
MVTLTSKGSNNFFRCGAIQELEKKAFDFKQ